MTTNSFSHHFHSLVIFSHFILSSFFFFFFFFFFLKTICQTGFVSKNNRKHFVLIFENRKQCQTDFMCFNLFFIFFPFSFKGFFFWVVFIHLYIFTHLLIVERKKKQKLANGNGRHTKISDIKKIDCRSNRGQQVASCHLAQSKIMEWTAGPVREKRMKRQKIKPIQTKIEYSGDRTVMESDCLCHLCTPLL